MGDALRLVVGLIALALASWLFAGVVFPALLAGGRP
jgi:hypothetical protein